MVIFLVTYLGVSIHETIGNERVSGSLSFPKTKEKGMPLINCPECDKQMSDQAGACPNCGYKIPKKQAPEEVLFSANPSMFKGDPVKFILSVILFPLGGFVVLMIWWVQCKGQTISVSTQRTIVRDGLLSKGTSEVLHEHVRNVQIRQGAIQRIFGTGTIAISSSGQSDMEIVFVGLVDPESVKAIIDKHRR